jgi:hypothetical protein
MDLLEGTKRGSILSYMAVTVMLTLFIVETRAYLKTRYVFILDARHLRFFHPPVEGEHVGGSYGFFVG